MDVVLLDHQYKFLKFVETYHLLVGGIGGGKTFGGAHFAIDCALNSHPLTMGLIGANTYRQLNNVTLGTFFKECDRIGLGHDYNRGQALVTLENGHQIYALSMDNYDMHRGIEIGWGWIDEARDMKREAFTMLQGRLRCKYAEKYRLGLTSSSKGFNWLYEYFHPGGELNTSDFGMTTSSSNDNHHLSDDFLRILKDTYDDNLYRQEVGGEFLNLTSGKVYRGFNREVNVRRVEQSDLPVYIGMDFNVSPFTAVIAHVVDDNKIEIFDELYFNDADTEQACIELIRRGYKGATVVADSTGGNRSTKAKRGMTDHIIIKDMGFNLARFRNPGVMDRYNQTNLKFQKNHITIDPSCKKTIKDLEQAVYKEGTSLMDTTDKTHGHISDGLGYLTWYIDPMVRPNVKIKVRAYA